MSKDPGTPTEYSAEWWAQKIDDRGKQLDEKWRTSADRVVLRYLDDRTSESDAVTFATTNEQRKYNIFWANVQILKAALYATPPKPVVKRVHDDPKDVVARTASLILQRMLVGDLQEDNSREHANIQRAVEDRLIPGLGQLWVRYDVETEEVEIPAILDPVTGQEIQPATKGERIADENVHVDYVQWRDFFWSPARVWEEVWWVGRRVWMKKKAFIKRFGQAKYDELKRVAEDVVDTIKYPKGFTLDRIEVFELWCESTEKIYWVNKELKLMLDEREVKLELDGFFPCPPPLLATHTSNDFLPRPDYVMIQDQYDELDILNNRISTLTKALRVVGMYDAANKDIANLLSAGECRMIPVEQWAVFAEAGGLKGVVDWFPLDVVAKVLQQLMEQRVAVIQQIYELTSISDIMRGVSQARETAKAQTLKAQYSSVRLQLSQQEVAKFVCGVLRLKAQIIARQFQPETILKKSGIMFTESAQYAEAAIQLIKRAELSEYRIVVSEESLSLADYNAEREMRVAFLTSIGQFLSQAGEMATAYPTALPYLLRMISWVAAGFRGSDDMQAVLDEAFQAAQQNPPTPQGKEGEGQQQQPPEDPVAAANANAQAQIAIDNNAARLRVGEIAAETKGKVVVETAKARLNPPVPPKPVSH